MVAETEVSGFASSDSRENRFHGPIRVKRSSSMKGVEDGQNRQALLA